MAATERVCDAQHRPTAHDVGLIRLEHVVIVLISWVVVIVQQNSQQISTLTPEHSHSPSGHC